MTDPFGLARPQAVTAAAKALNATLINCWPRITESGNIGELVRILSICWLNLDSGNDIVDRPSERDIAGVAPELKKASAILSVIWKQEGEKIPPQVDGITRQEPELRQLFATLEPSPQDSDVQMLTEE